MQPGIGFSLFKGCLCAISAFIISSSLVAPGGWTVLIWVLAGGALGAYSSMVAPSEVWHKSPLRVVPSDAGACLPLSSPEVVTCDAPAYRCQDCKCQMVSEHGPPPDARLACLPTLLQVIDTAVFSSAAAKGQQPLPGQDPLSLEECSEILSQNMPHMIERRKVRREE